MDNAVVDRAVRPTVLHMTFEVGDYRATELIGSGGSAQVWLGRRGSDGTRVAIKVFAPGQLAMARREAALAAAVDHPHVVTVLDVVGDTQRAALVTEFAAGGDLAELLARRRRLSPGETLTVLLPIAAALATAHERQVVHGDLSAQNILFDQAGRPLLADLGAGRAAAEMGLPVSATPEDAAPELARGAEPSPASDMFSLGSLALACLTGRHAWPADDLRDVLIQAAAGQWPDPGDDGGPAALITSIRAVLEHDPERRPGAAALVMDLRAAGRPEPVDLQIPLQIPPSPEGSMPPDYSGAIVIGGPEAAGPRLEGRVGAGVRTEGASGSTPQVHPRRVVPAEAEPPDSGRPARARAVTRLRADAVPRPEPVRPARRPGLLQFRGSRRRSGAQPGEGGRGAPELAAGRRSHALRVGLIVLACVLVTAMAGAGGLWWAGWDRTEPVGLSQATQLAQASGGSRGLTTPSTVSRSSRSVAPAPGSTHSGSIGSTTTARPSPAPAKSTTPRISPTLAATATSLTPRASGSAPVTPDWTATVRALDDARANALVARDVSLLDAVYTSDSVARTADANMIASLISGGLRVSGAEHLVRTTKVIGLSPIRLEVDDSLPSYSILDTAGRVVGQTTSRAVSARVMVLVRIGSGYRISKVQSA